MLLVINGAPAVGKSTLARRYADDHPLALVIDVDLLRTHLGGWQHHDASKALARDLAVALARSHLSAGHDVVVPQYVGRPEFLSRLGAVAGAAGVAYVEVVLADDPERVAERFRIRRARADDAVRHPEYDLDEAAIDQVVADANADLVRAAAERGAAIIDASGGVEPAYDALRRCLRLNA